MVSKQPVLVINVSDAGEMDRNNVLNDFGKKGQIIMAIWLGWSNPKMARLVVRIYQEWSKEGQTTNQHGSLGAKGSSMHKGKETIRVPMMTFVYNGHVSIRTGPCSSGRMLPDLMCPVFFYTTSTAVYVFMVYLGMWWHQDALWDDDNPVEGVWCSG